MVKNTPANAGDIRHIVLIPGLGNPLEEGMATHSSVLALRIRRTEEPGRLHTYRITESDTTKVTLHSPTVQKEVMESPIGNSMKFSSLHQIYVTIIAYWQARKIDIFLMM